MAQDMGTFELTSPASTASWSGHVVLGAMGALNTPLPEACLGSTLCDTVGLNLELPPGVWSSPGGMLVAIQWPAMDVGYDLDLVVYGPDGREAGESNMWTFDSGEAVWVPNPVNGHYRVVVVPKLVVSAPVSNNFLAPLAYRGFVDFERGKTITRPELNNGQPYARTVVDFSAPTVASTPTLLLPHLVPTKPANFHMETTGGATFYFYGDRGLRHPPSCYPAETAGLDSEPPAPSLDPPLHCLRWDQGEFNFGSGPFELHNYPDLGGGTPIHPNNDMYQRVYRSDGSAEEFAVGKGTFSQAHGHMHMLGFSDARLYGINADGSPDNQVAAAADKGICVTDVDNGRFAETNDSPLGFPVLGSCDQASHQDPNDPLFPNASFFQMGISVGWADLYPWFIADQYIDVTHIPDGNYLLVVEINATKRILEQSYDDSTATACVTISNQGTEAKACAAPSAASALPASSTPAPPPGSGAAVAGLPNTSAARDSAVALAAVLLGSTAAACRRSRRRRASS